MAQSTVEDVVHVQVSTHSVDQIMEDLTESTSRSDDMNDFGDLAMGGDDDYDSEFDDDFRADVNDLQRKSNSNVLEIQEHLRGRSDEIFFLSESRASTLRHSSSLSSLFDEPSISSELMDSPSADDRPADPAKKFHRLPSANYLAEVMSGSVEFSILAFVREWMYNFFHPFSLPICFLLEGSSGARSRGYWGFHNGYAVPILGLISNLWFWVLQILYWTQVRAGNFSIEYTLFTFLYLARIFAVAIKWGYQPEEVFDYMREKTLNKNQTLMLHLLQGWANVQPMAIAREILQSAGRLKVDIHKFRFVFRDDDSAAGTKGMKEKKPKQKKRYQEVYCNCKTSEPTRGDLLIPYLLFMTSRSMAAKYKHKFKFIVITATTLSVLQTVGRLANGTFMHLTTPERAFNILNVIYTIYLFSLQLMFLNVVAIDLKRRADLQVFCTRLIQPGRHAFVGRLGETYKDHLWPRINVEEEANKLFEELNLQSIDLTNASTIFYWAQLRRFLMDFGLRWLRREEGLLTLYGSLILVFEAGVLFAVFVIRYTAFNVYDYIVAFAAIFIFGVPVMRALSLAQRINYSRDKQRAILSEKRLNLHKEAAIGHGHDMIDPTSPEGISLARAVLMIDKIMEMMKHGRYTITFLGFRIDVTVTSLVASVLGSLGFTLARVLTTGQGV